VDLSVKKVKSMEQEEMVKKLEQFASRNRIPFYSCFNKQRKLPNLARRYIAARYVIYDLNQIQEGLYFLFYDSSTGGAHGRSGWGDTFCGLYSEIEGFNANVIIKERLWLDGLSFKKRHFSGKHDIDKRLSILSDSKLSKHDFLSVKKLRHFMDMKTSMPALRVETEVEAWNIIPELDQKTLLSIRVSHWLIDSSKIKWFIENACKYLLDESFKFPK